MTDHSVSSPYATRLAPGGRVVIPAALRQRLGFVEGEALVLREVDGELRITSRRRALERAQARVRAALGDAAGSLTAELIAERREAASDGD